MYFSKVIFLSLTSMAIATTLETSGSPAPAVPTIELEKRASWHMPKHLITTNAHLANAAQRVTEVTNTFLHNPSRGGAAALTALITGIDGQIDASLGEIFKVAHYATFGLSDPLAHFILGPFFQSITDGIEVLIGNLAGSAIDLAVPGSFMHNMKALVKQAKAYHMDASKLAHMSEYLEETLPVL